MKTISDLLEVKPIFQGLIEALPDELGFLGVIDGAMVIENWSRKLFPILI